MVDLTTLNTGLKTREIGGSVVDHDNKLYWRTTVTSSDGKRSDRRIRLDLPSNSSQVLEAENRVIRLAAEIARLGILPDLLTWASEIRKFPDSVPNALTIAEAITQLENDFWNDKQRSSQALRRYAKDPQAREFVETVVRENLNSATGVLSNAAPRLAEELVRIALDPAVKQYARVSAISECFKILGANVLEAEQRRQLQAIRNQLQAIEDGVQDAQVIDV